MSHRLIRAAMLSVLAAASASSISAQTPAKLPPLLPEAEELAMALEAAPPNVADGAAVYVLRRGGHVKVREGRNGFSCLVSRDHPESLYPVCYDADASRTVLPVELREQQLRERGKSEAEVASEIGLAYRTGELRIPTRGSMAYMMSPRQVIYDGPNGRRVGQYRPHLMLYLPYATDAELGLGDPSVRRTAFLAMPGAPNAHLIIALTDWAKSPQTSAR